MKKCLLLVTSIYLKFNDRIWYGVDMVSTMVGDFFGVTAPRYEMYIDDSIEYQSRVFVFLWVVG